MAPKPVFAKFKPSASTDVEGYRITVVPDINAVAPSNLVTEVLPPYNEQDGKIMVDLQERFPDLDGKYTVSITAFDDAGNESAALEGYTTLDFVVPGAPTELEFVSG